MPRQQHSYEDLAGQMASWLDETANALADGMRENGRAPFAAPTTDQERQRFYADALWLPDGRDNQAGRSALMQRLGEQGYIRTLAEMTDARAKRVQSALGRTGGDAAAMGGTDGNV